MPKEFMPDETLQALLAEKVPLLKRLLEGCGNEQALYELMQGMHASEIAYVVQYLDHPHREAFIQWLKPRFDPEIFLFLSPQVRTEIIALLSVMEIRAILDVLESDDALSLLAALDEDKRTEVLAVMPTALRHNFLQRLSYGAHSAGRLMQQEVLAFPHDWTLKQSLEWIAHSHVPDQLYDAFVVNAQGHPVGIVGLSQLIKLPKNLHLYEVMQKDIHPISAHWKQEDVALTFRMYDLMCAPVVNDKGILIGLITADDVIDIMDRKATEDLLHMGRVHGSDFYNSVWHTSMSRLNWLVVTLLNSMLTSLVIHEFQTTLQARVALATLMPIAAAMGGNTGIQTTTIVIRALATKELTRVNMTRSFSKEVRVACLNGIIFGSLLGLIVYVWFQNATFACILAAAVFFNMIWAGGAGTLLPVMISRMGFDPALSAGPLLTTTTDVIGYAIFLWLARCWLA